MGDKTDVVRRDRIRMGPLDAAPGAALSDEIAVEEPLEIRVAGEPLAITMRTPGADRELAVGFLYAEGVLASLEDVGSLAICGRPGDQAYGNALDVVPAAGARLDLERLDGARRGTLTTAACGVCGRMSIDDLLARCTPHPRPVAFGARMLAALGGRLTGAQPGHARTGGLHAAGLFDEEGRMGPVLEDVGRHNAVDKVIGAALLARSLDGWCGLVVSGRSSFEIVQKAAVARLVCVVGVSAPTSLAVDLAHEAGITLVGFARGERASCYTHPERLVF